MTGSGLGGRNQELALAAAPGLEGLSDAAVFSFGSDGTDGPTDAAGGYADGRTAAILRALGRTAEAWLDDNDACMRWRRPAACCVPARRARTSTTFLCC